MQSLDFETSTFQFSPGRALANDAGNIGNAHREK
jgi:hypothetical protein